MKVLSAILTFNLLLLSNLFGQKYHSSAEIIKILNDSKLSYEIANLEESDSVFSIQETRVLHGLFLEKTDGNNWKTNTYDNLMGGNEKYKTLLKEADSCLSVNKVVEARQKYLQLLDMSPNNAQMMTYIGQTYEAEKNSDETIKWYTNAINTNFLDYMAHWFLADMYLDKMEYEKSIEEITIAHLMNRNHPGIVKALDKIYKRSNMKFNQLEFKPKYSLSKGAGNKVNVKFSQAEPEWMGYILCKAVWNYEPGYKEEMLKKNQMSPALLEETECLLSTMTGESNKNKELKSSNPFIQSAFDAAKDRQLSNFVFYEIALRTNPYLCTSLNKDNVKDLIEYIKKYRTEKFDN